MDEGLRIEKVEKEEEYSGEQSESKGVLVVVAGLVLIFALFVGGSALYNHLTGSSILTLSNLHQKNVEGGLDSEEGYLYNGYSFVHADGVWFTEVQRGNQLLQIPLRFGPRELEEVNVAGTLDPAFNEGENVYISYDPSVADKHYSLAASELLLNIVQGQDRNPVGACITDDPVCEGRPIVSCADPQGKPVIELSFGGDPRVEASGTCVRISGEEFGIVKAVDRLLYKWYGVME